MSNFYVSSVDGNDTTPPSVSWWDGSHATYATVTAALAAATGAGPHVIHVDDAHSGSTVGVTWDLATAGQEMSILCVDRDVGVLAATAVVAVSTNANAINLFTGAGAQNVFVHGIIFNGHNGASSSNDINVCTGGGGINGAFKNCQFNVAGNASGATCAFGASITAGIKPRLTLDNCSATMANNTAAACAISMRCGKIEIRNGFAIAFAGASKPTVCFGAPANTACDLTIQDCDLSGYDNASGFYFTVDDLSSGTIRLINCKTSSSPGVITGTWQAGNAAEILLVNVDSGDTHNRFAYYNRLGTITVDTGIYRDNGAQFDGAGVSWKIITNAACSEHQPFRTPWIERWVANVVSTVFGIEFVHDSATLLTDRNCFAEIEYLSSASFPIGSVANDRNAVPFIGTAANQTTSTEAYTGIGGFTNQTKQKAHVTVTPAEKSLVRGRLVVGVASKTLYMDPGMTVV